MHTYTNLYTNRINTHDNINDDLYFITKRPNHGATKPNIAAVPNSNDKSKLVLNVKTNIPIEVIFK